MSFIGCIGYLMQGNGLKETSEVTYAPNAVMHMMSGKAVSRAVRVHFIVDSALNALITSEAFRIEDIDSGQHNDCIPRLSMLQMIMSHKQKMMQMIIVTAPYHLFIYYNILSQGNLNLAQM